MTDRDQLLSQAEQLQAALALNPDDDQLIAGLTLVLLQLQAWSGYSVSVPLPRLRHEKAGTWPPVRGPSNLIAQEEL